MSNSKLNIAILSLIGLFPLSIAFAQTLKEKETELKGLIPKILKSKSENERLETAITFNNEFKHLLEKPESFKYNFDSLTNLSRAFSDDNRIKIYTFLVPMDNGTYKYFGLVQFNNTKNGNLPVIELNDKQEEIKNFAQAQTNNKNWHGAIYYRCITNTYKKKTYYTLLGWDGHTNLTNRKLIEPLLIGPKGELKFGDLMFTDETNKRNRRIIFEHSEQASMSLKYYPESQEIVFDHLSPPEPQLIGQYQFYGPDFSYDAYKFDKGKWHLIKDVLPRNEKEQEINPKKVEKIKDNIMYKPK